MLAIALALGSSACYGVSNFVGPQLAKRHTIVAVLVTSQLAAMLACVVYVVADGASPLSAHNTAIALLAGVGNAGGLIGFYKAAELGPLSVAAPIGALGAVVPVVWGLLDGEALRSTEAVGLLLAIGGGAMAARVTPTEEVVYPDPRKSVLWASLSAVSFGVFLTALPQVSDDGRAWSLLDARIALVTIVLLWAGVRLRALRPGRASWVLSIPGLLLVAGTLLYTVAADHGQLSIVSVLGSLFPVFTVGLAAALLAERLSREQAIGVTAALAGIVLIAV
ncbi:MAG: EamA family transporter [Solirubrobacterales bacterium]